jgi:hypothetical protein
MENFFLGAGAKEPGTEPDLARLAELAAEHGWRFSGA